MGYLVWPFSKRTFKVPVIYQWYLVSSRNAGMSRSPNSDWCISNMPWFDDITSRASNNHTLFNSNNFDSLENERWIGTLTNLPSPIAESTDKFTVVTQNKPGNNCSNGLWYVYSLSRIENMFFSMNLWKYTVTCQDIQSLLLGERISLQFQVG